MRGEVRKLKPATRGNRRQQFALQQSVVQRTVPETLERDHDRYCQQHFVVHVPVNELERTGDNHWNVRQIERPNVKIALARKPP
jgi:hypothetical protein